MQTVAINTDITECHARPAPNQARMTKARGLVIFLFFVVGLILVLPQFSPYDMSQLDGIELLDANLPPSWQAGGEAQFLLGTDDQGRDILSLILYATRLSIIIALAAVLLQTFLGVTLGLVAGYWGGLVDRLVMGWADIQLSFTTMIVAILALAMFHLLLGGELFARWSIYIMIGVIAISEWPQYARTLRAKVLTVRRSDFIEAARLQGYSSRWIVARHLLPNVVGPVYVMATVQFANAIITEAALSFLGLGLPATVPSLGSAIHSGFAYLHSGQWWMVLFPAIALVGTVYMVNIIGESLSKSGFAERVQR